LFKRSLRKATLPYKGNKDDRAIEATVLATRLKVKNQRQNDVTFGGLPEDSGNEKLMKGNRLLSSQASASTVSRASPKSSIA